MPYQKGEDINIGVAMNPDARGTDEFVDVQMWIPGRTPTGIAPVLEKVLLRETRASGIDSQGSEIVQKRAEGDLEFNTRCNSIGYLLKSLLGKVTSSDQIVDGGEVGLVYVHDFEILPQDPEFPTLSLGLSQPSIHDYEYRLALVKTLEIRTPVDDLVNATVGFLASKEETKSGGAFDPSFDANDYSFRHQDVVVKLADTGTDYLTLLNSASALSLKEFSLMIDNNARVDQNIGELNPGNVLANLIKVGATLKADLLVNLDQKIGGTGGTDYVVTTAIDEGPSHKQTFTPTKKYQTKVEFEVIAKGTDSWTVTVHKGAGTDVIAVQTIPTADIVVGKNIAVLPFTWTEGAYHLHITSPTAGGKVATSGDADLEDAEMSFFYAAYKELSETGVFKSMRVEMTRSDINIGAATKHPKLTFNFPKVSFEGWTPDRPLEDIATVGVDMVVHYDSANAKAFAVELINEQDDYDKA